MRLKTRSKFQLLCLAGLLSGCGDNGDEDCEPTGADETACDGVDDDCDGEIDEDATLPTFWADTDGDGYGDPDAPIEACEAPASTVANDDDCNDADDAISPAAFETCDGIDNDCDGLVDDADGSTSGGVSVYVDGDGDGVGTGPAWTFCEVPDGYVDSTGDCDDQNSDVNPHAEEVCDEEEVDEDCDGLVNTDDDDLSASSYWYDDTDGDGYGDPDTEEITCEPTAAQVDNGDDCDDDEGEINPGAEEICLNLIDDDCDGGANDCQMIDGAVASDALPFTFEGSNSTFGRALGMGDLLGTGTDQVVISDMYDFSYAGGIYVFETDQSPSALSTTDASAIVRGASYLGSQLQIIEDMNGDGTDELLGMQNDGTALLFAGPLGTVTLASQAESTISGLGTSINSFGHYLASGDFSGDGTSDLVISQPYAGEVHYILGPVDSDLSLPDDTDIMLYEEPNASIYPGHQVSSVGDLDGDGRDDAVIADYYGYDSSGVTSGHAWIVLTDDIAEGAYFSDVGTFIGGPGVSSAYFGYSLASDDVDGDGTADILLSAPNDSTYGDGSLYMFSGAAPASSAEDADAILYNAKETPYFGYDITAGDLDDDGKAEIIVGDLGSSEVITYGGAAHIFHGGVSGRVSTNTALGRVEGHTQSGYVGGQVYAGHDVTGDGIDDLLIGAYSNSTASLLHGGGL